MWTQFFAGLLTVAFEMQMSACLDDESRYRADDAFEAADETSGLRLTQRSASSGTCPLWDLAAEYQPGQKITYQDQGYVANRFVYQNTPPIASDNEWLIFRRNCHEHSCPELA